MVEHQSRKRERRDHELRRVKAHVEVVERWREERPVDLQRLKDIYEGHLGQPLYKPMRICHDVEREFYEEVRERTKEMPPQVPTES